jgi:hypothetical protein
MDAYPTLLIGAGGVGGEMVRRAHCSVAEQAARRADAARLPLRSLLLTPRGLTFLEEPPGEETSNGQQEPGTRVASWDDPLDDALHPGVWNDNFERLTPHRQRIGSALERAVRSAQQLSTAHEGAGGSGSSLDVKASPLNVYVVSSMACPVGTAGLVLLLEEIANMFGEIFPGLQRQTQVVLPAPDLLPGNELLPEGNRSEKSASAPSEKREQAREQAHVRAYTFLQELEEALDPDRRGARAPEVGLTWLLSSQNANDFFVTSYRDLFPVLSRQVAATMEGLILQDHSFAVTLSLNTGGKSRRYSAFGHARLVFPRRRLFESTLAAATHRALRAFPGLERRPIEADEAHAETRRFVQNEEWDRLADKLQQSTSGEDLWQPFSPPAHVQNEERPNVFLQKLDQYVDGYESEQESHMQRAIGQRKTNLVREQRRAVLDRVHAFLDDEDDDNGVARALAWLAALEGRASEYIQGDIDAPPVTLRKLDEDVKGFFDQRFAPMLFEEEEEEEAASSAQNRRERLSTLRFDLTTKRRKRERTRQNIARLTAELDDLPPVTTGAQVPFTRPSAAEMRDALSDPERWSAIETSYDADRRDAEARAAQEDERHRLKRNLESARSNVESLTSDIQQGEEEEERLAREVNELDRVIGDASERRHLFAPLVEEDREAIDESRGAFRKAGQARRQKERRLNDLGNQVWWKLLGALAWPITVVALLVGLLWWSATSLPQRLAAPLPDLLKPLVVDAGWLSLGGGWLWGLSLGLLVAALLVAVVRLWFSYLRPHRSLQRELQKRKQEEQSQKRTLIQQHRQLQQKRFKRRVYGSLVDWREEVGSLIRELREQLEHFPQAVEKLTSRAKLRGEASFDAPDGQFTRHVMPPGGTADLLEQRAESLALRIEEFWDDHPVSNVFEAFRSGSDAAPLDDFADTLRRELTPVFDDLKDMSLVSFMKEAYPSEEARQRHIVQVFERAAALASPHQMQGAVEEKIYAGVLAQDEADRFVRETLADAGTSNLSIYQGPPDEVAFFRLTLAFAGFQFTPARRGRACLQRREPQKRAAFYLWPDHHTRLPDLVPSSHRLGTAQDEVRKVACLTLAYGIATRQMENGHAVIAVGDETFFGYEAWINHLNDVDGTSMRHALEQRLEQLRTEANENDLHRQLADSRDHKWVDAIDREIIEQEMERHAEI